jgi:hypothetical protein
MRASWAATREGAVPPREAGEPVVYELEQFGQFGGVFDFEVHRDNDAVQ